MARSEGSRAPVDSGPRILRKVRRTVHRLEIDRPNPENGHDALRGRKPRASRPPGSLQSSNQPYKARGQQCVMSARIGGSATRDSSGDVAAAGAIRAPGARIETARAAAAWAKVFADTGACRPCLTTGGVGLRRSVGHGRWDVPGFRGVASRRPRFVSGRMLAFRLVAHASLLVWAGDDAAAPSGSAHRLLLAGCAVSPARSQSPFPTSHRHSHPDDCAGGMNRDSNSVRFGRSPRLRHASSAARTPRAGHRSTAAWRGGHRSPRPRPLHVVRPYEARIADEVPDDLFQAHRIGIDDQIVDLTGEVELLEGRLRAQALQQLLDDLGLRSHRTADDVDRT
jgi:hypothetical protein